MKPQHPDYNPLRDIKTWLRLSRALFMSYVIFAILFQLLNLMVTSSNIALFYAVPASIVGLATFILMERSRMKKGDPSIWDLREQQHLP